MIDVEQVLEFNVIKEKLASFAFTGNGKKNIMELEPYMSEVEVTAKLRETTEARVMLEKAGNPPFTSLDGIEDLIEIAIKGGCLSAEQLSQIAVTLTAVSRLKGYLEGCKRYETSLAYYEENLDTLENVREAINQKIRNNAVDDYATKNLKNIRSSISSMESKMRAKADTILRNNKNYMSDSFSTFRNGHLCVPVKSDCRSKIQGQVIDKSATGNTVFVEPSPVARYFEELQGLKIDEENEVRTILYSLTDMVADIKEQMSSNMHIIEKMDFIFAKAKLSIEYDGIKPQINTDRYIKIVNGRHPLMDKNISVPLNFEIGGDITGIVITGPNTGGKTVAIKTVALNCLMAQCGLHVSCGQADICLNDRILCDIGDGQNISENLSTFSAHISNILDILRKAGKESLVILDELGSGTDPTEGMGIAIAILDELKKSGSLFLATTHYPEVKNYAEKESNIINARMTFDKITLKPLYQLVIGEAGQSCAFYIAEKLGMPESMLFRACQEAYGIDIPEQYDYIKKGNKKHDKNTLKHEKTMGIRKRRTYNNYQEDAKSFNVGDSVMIYPDKKIGIVCEKANDKGILRVQLRNKKIWINHKRVKLHVPASQLYPDDYDFSIVFDSVENRKLRHKMERKHVEDEILKIED